jgi:hypothetical protein
MEDSIEVNQVLDGDYFVYPSKSFEIGQPAIQLTPVLVPTINSAPQYQILVTNYSDEPHTFKPGTYMAKATQIDCNWQACPLTRETWKRHESGTLDLNHICIANLNCDRIDFPVYEERLEKIPEEEEISSQLD